LRLGVVNYRWNSIKSVEYSSRRCLSVIEEENYKEFHKIIDGDVAGHDHSGLGIIEVAVEIMGCVYKSLRILGRVKPKTTPYL
jgi:hypothetical protein